MLSRAVVFLALAIITALFGSGGIAGTTAWIAQVLFALFLDTHARAGCRLDAGCRKPDPALNSVRRCVSDRRGPATRRLGRGVAHVFFGCVGQLRLSLDWSSGAVGLVGTCTHFLRFKDRNRIHRRRGDSQARQYGQGHVDRCGDPDYGRRGCGRCLVPVRDCHCAHLANFLTMRLVGSIKSYVGKDASDE
jgi:uncharacterized membrane protein YtjA (UPF0391 family)